MPLFFYALSSTGLIYHRSKAPFSAFPLLLPVDSRSALLRTEKGERNPIQLATFS